MLCSGVVVTVTCPGYTVNYLDAPVGSSMLDVVVLCMHKCISVIGGQSAEEGDT